MRLANGKSAQLALRSGEGPPSHYRCTFVSLDPGIRGVLLVPIAADGTKRAPVQCEFPAEIVRQLRVGGIYRFAVEEFRPPAVIEAEGNGDPAPWRAGRQNALIRLSGRRERSPRKPDPVENAQRAFKNGRVALGA